MPVSVTGTQLYVIINIWLGHEISYMHVCFTECNINEEQEMWFGEDLHGQWKIRVGYLNPRRIYNGKIMVIMGQGHNELQGKANEEIEQIKAQKQQAKEIELTT